MRGPSFLTPIALVLCAGALMACRTMNEDHATSAVQATGATNLTPPPSGSTDNPLDVDAVVQAMIDVHDAFYVQGKVYTKPFSPNSPVPPEREPDACYGACPTDRWSALLCRYYCQFPSYSAVIPNIRGCFTNAVAGTVAMADGSKARNLTYPEAYDYCVHQDFDAILKRVPAFDPKVIAANKAAGLKPGVMKWVDDKQGDVFKYVMFTSGNVKAFKDDDVKSAVERFDAHIAKLRDAANPRPAPVTGGCGGVLVKGYCWYPTTPGGNGDCAATCAKHGGVHPATNHNFTNDEKECGDVVNAVTKGNVTLNIVDCSRTTLCGCFHRASIMHAFICANEKAPDHCAEIPDAVRMCACHD